MQLIFTIDPFFTLKQPKSVAWTVQISKIFTCNISKAL